MPRKLQIKFDSYPSKKILLGVASELNKDPDYLWSHIRITKNYLYVSSEDLWKFLKLLNPSINKFEYSRLKHDILRQLTIQAKLKPRRQNYFQSHADFIQKL